MASRAAADEVIARYNGAVADGNALKVEMIKQSLTDRMTGRSSAGASTSARFGAPSDGANRLMGSKPTRPTTQELLPVNGNR